MARRTSAELREVFSRRADEFIAAQISRFVDRGFSYRTIVALIKSGIDFPEKLLNKSEVDILRIPGVGKICLAEIMKYREEFGKQ